MDLLRLKGRKTCDLLLRRGRVWKGRNLNVRYLEGHPRHPSAQLGKPGLYTGTIASTKLDKSAVKRNRMRRRCREAFRITAGKLDIPVALQLLIAPRSSSLGCPFAELERDARAFLTTIAHGTSKKEQ